MSKNLDVVKKTIRDNWYEYEKHLKEHLGPDVVLQKVSIFGSWNLCTQRWNGPRLFLECDPTGSSRVVGIHVHPHWSSVTFPWQLNKWKFEGASVRDFEVTRKDVLGV